MNILITGSGGFVGKNLTEALKNIRDGKDRTHPALKIGGIFECTRATSESELEDYCKSADFVFNLAGVNRPKDTAEFYEGNRDFTQNLRFYSNLQVHPRLSRACIRKFPLFLARDAFCPCCRVCF